MADEKKKLERVYNIPLRKEYQKSPHYRRAKKSIFAIREFLKKHMKSYEVKIGKYLNEKIWEHGIKNPPHHVKVNCTKDEKGVVTVELFDAPKDKQEKKEKSKEMESTKKVESKNSVSKKEDAK
jgi:large subunit ribosomal protein L31e